MKLQYIYLLIGLFTLAANIILTIHIIRSNTAVWCREARGDEELITFRLSEGNGNENSATIAVSYEDTMPLE